MVVAIDGPSGVGKTTVARAVAERLDLPHLDTGSFYRAATLVVLRAGVEEPEAVVAAVAASHLDYADGRFEIDGVDPDDELRGPDVTAAVSWVSAIPELRAHVVELQRDWVRRHGGSAVVEGRDIGTVVFPDAPVKVYLTASPEVRAERRADDAEAAGVTIAQLAQDLARRDRADSTRAASPLKPAADAVTIDTGDLSVDEVVETILRLVSPPGGGSAGR